jgi:hypothetical protein
LRIDCGHGNINASHFILKEGVVIRRMYELSFDTQFHEDEKDKKANGLH